MTMRLCRGVLGTRDVWWLDAALAADLPDFARAECVYEGTYTRIWRHPERKALLSKVSRVKTAPRDNLRKYTACQAYREIMANQTLQRLGLDTAELLGFGMPVAPWARLDSILFMRELAPHDTLRVVLRAVTDAHERNALLGQVAADVAAIYRNGYHHKDCHLENVLRRRAHDDLPTDSERLIWIDNDLRYSTHPVRARERLAGSLAQLVNTSRGFISAVEWRYFSGALAGHLCCTDLGRELADTTVADFRAGLSEDRS